MPRPSKVQLLPCTFFVTDTAGWVQGTGTAGYCVLLCTGAGYCCPGTAVRVLLGPGTVLARLGTSLPRRVVILAACRFYLFYQSYQKCYGSTSFCLHQRYLENRRLRTLRTRPVPSSKSLPLGVEDPCQSASCSFTKSYQKCVESTSFCLPQRYLRISCRQTSHALSSRVGEVFTAESSKSGQVSTVRFYQKSYKRGQKVPQSVYLRGTSGSGARKLLKPAPARSDKSLPRRVAKQASPYLPCC